MTGLRKSTLDTSRKNRRIVPADSFLKQMTEFMSLNRVADHLKKTPKEVEEAIKNARVKRHFIYTDENDKPLAAYRPDGTKSKLTAGKAMKEAITATPNAVMDLACVLTSKNKDRDGDILHPDGAIVDPAMPFLFQHIPFENCGKLVKVLSQDGELITCQFATHNTALGNDVSTMIEFGSLRISHGFVPIDYDILRDDAGRELNGWDVKRYNVFEGSGVSIPANIDAIITATSRNKFASAICKGWGDCLFENRKRLFTDDALAKMGRTSKSTDAGGSRVTVNVKLDGLAQLLVATSKGAANGKVRKKGKKGDDPDNPDDKDDDDPNDPNAPTDKDDPDATDANGNPTPQKGPTPFPDLVNACKGLAGDEMPDEAKNRINTANGILDTLSETIKTVGEKIAGAALSYDLPEMMANYSTVIEALTTSLSGCAEELARAAEVGEVPEGTASKIKAAADQCATIRDAVNVFCGDDGSSPSPAPDASVADADANPEVDDDANPGDVAKGKVSPVVQVYARAIAGDEEFTAEERELLEEVVDSFES